MLTGKAKEDFTNWFRDNINLTLDLTIIEDFYLYPFSMQWGVYVDFFDSIGINLFITCCYNADEEIETFTYYFIPEFDNESPDFKTREEARKDALDMCNEIYNQAKN